MGSNLLHQNRARSQPHRMKFTQAAVDGLAPPKNGRVEVWDSLLPGFGLRVSQTGLKTWQVLYRVDGRMVRQKLGTLMQVPRVDDARATARECMTQARQGVNPAVLRRAAKEERQLQTEAEVARQLTTLAVVIERYLSERPKFNRKGRPLSTEYLDEIRRALTRDVARSKLGAKPIDEVDSKAIKALVRGIAAQNRGGQANHVLTYLTTALQWAVSEEIIERNPAAGIQSPAARYDRERVLDDDEIRLFWKACDKIGWPFGYMYQLLLLMGPRRDELAGAGWGEFKLDKKTGTGVWTLPARRIKKGGTHIIHLTRFAAEILQKLPRVANPNNYVFCTGRGGTINPPSGCEHAAQRVEKEVQKLAKTEGLPEIEHFTLHDLRRSAASGMARIGVAPHVVDKILNHSTGQIRGVMATYNRYQYLPERKAALEQWARHVESLVRPPPAAEDASDPPNVIALRRAEV